MSENYDLELRRAIDRIVRANGLKELRSDDPYIRLIYSDDEKLAIEALRIYADGKGQYFDKQRKRLMPRCEFSMIDGHAVVDLIRIDEDPAERIAREKYVENKKRKALRRDFP